MPYRRLFAIVIARALAVAGGVAVIVWSAQSGQLAWRDLGLSDAATKVAGEEPFKDELLAGLEPKMAAVESDPACTPSALHDVAVIRLRQAESAMVGGKRAEIDPALRRLDAVARRSLQCSPMDPFLWLALYWVDVQLNGARAEALAPLEMSYRLGPNEGWIALRRSRYGLAAFDQVSPATREAILNEERSLLDAGFAKEVGENLTGAGWPIHDLILARLADATAENRELLARRLRHDGYEMRVPGIVLDETRPWD